MVLTPLKRFIESAWDYKEVRFVCYGIVAIFILAVAQNVI